MKHRIFFYLLSLTGLFILLFTACEKHETFEKGRYINYRPIEEIPSVTTIAVSEITPTLANCGGIITSDGELAIQAKGVCWSTDSTPLITDNKTTDGVGSEKFSSAISGLNPNTIYYIRAYATNTLGTAYGSVISFITKQEKGTKVYDIDSNIYYCDTIGTQVWLIENLKTTRYNDGIAIPLVTGNTFWSNQISDGYCWYYHDKSKYKNPYGALYNWHTVNSGKLCPTGWHVPTDAEWTILTDYLGGESIAAIKLKESGTTHWIPSNIISTNESGFTALPGGYRDTTGQFLDIGIRGGWWTSTEDSSNFYNAWNCRMEYINSKVNKSDYSKKIGFSVRCIKD
ncbi:MAG: fibrobacter succinogenes major paralogous domain-containing protein [Saprospiraceae bacterium]|nr:fibrobacter succinogenes major paralogous domain-containing protein [Saprospiraceae bacterium]